MEVLKAEVDPDQEAVVQLAMAFKLVQEAEVREHREVVEPEEASVEEEEMSGEGLGLDLLDVT